MRIMSILNLGKNSIWTYLLIGKCAEAEASTKLTLPSEGS